MLRLLSAFALALSLAPSLAAAAGPPTWDKAIAATSRFKPALGGAALLDKETGLVWDAAPAQASYYSFATAQAHCGGLVLGGRAGWRVPSLEEMLSLAVPRPGAPFVYQSDYYWTATTVAGAPASGWIADLTQATPAPLSLTKGNTELVWCVRGGHGYDGQ